MRADGRSPRRSTDAFRLLRRPVGRCGRCALFALGTLGRFGRHFALALGEARGTEIIAMSSVIVVGDDDTGRQLHVAHVELVAEHEARDVVLDLGRAAGRGDLDRERVHELLEHAALRRRLRAGLEVEADLGLDRLVGPHPHEVDVDAGCPSPRRAAPGGRRELSSAVDLQGDQRVGAAPRREDVAELLAPTP